MRPRHWITTGATVFLLTVSIGCHMGSPYGNPYGGYGPPAYNNAPMYNGAPQPIPNGSTIPPGGTQPPDFNNQPFPADGYEGLPPSNEPSDPYSNAPPFEGNTSLPGNIPPNNNSVPDYNDPGNFSEPSTADPGSDDPFERDTRFEQDLNSSIPNNQRNRSGQVSVTSWPTETFVADSSPPNRLPTNPTSLAAPVPVFASGDNVYNHDRKNYRWLSGRLSYDQRERGWYLMYNLRPGQSDRFGGDIGLSGVNLDSRYEQAPIRVHGYVANNDRDAQGKPKYYVQRYTILPTSQQQ